MEPYFCCPCRTKLIYKSFILRSQVFMVWLSFDTLPFSTLHDITDQALTRWQWPWGHAWWWPLGLRERTQEMERPGTMRQRTGTSSIPSTSRRFKKILCRLWHLFFLAELFSPYQSSIYLLGIWMDHLEFTIWYRRWGRLFWLQVWLRHGLFHLKKDWLLGGFANQKSKNTG